MSDYAMWIPFVNREDLLEKALNSAWDLRDNLTIIDNSKDGIERAYPGFYVFRPPVPLSCSQTFNYIMHETRKLGASICIWMHNDAEAHPGVCLQLVEHARLYRLQGRKWGVLFTHYDTLSAINVKLLDVIGEWDTVLPQYYTDNDYYRRVRLAGYECIETGLQVDHVGSQTIKSDPEWQIRNSATFPLYGFYYQQKWGGTPGHERFETAFNLKLKVDACADACTVQE